MTKKISVEYKEMNEEEFIKYGSVYTSTLKIPTDNIEEIEKALNVLGFNIWEIREDDSLSGTRIKASPLLLKWEQAKQNERDDHDKKMLKSAEEFNAHDKFFAVWDVGYIVKIEKSVTPAEHKPAYSSRVRGYTNINIYDTTGKKIEMNLSNYITASGSIQKKKFSEQFPEVPEEIAKRILDIASEVLTEQRKISARYNLRY